MTETNPLFDQVFVLCAGGLLVSGLLLGSWLFLRWWQRQQARRQRLAGLGYTPQPQTPDGLLGQVAAVYRAQGARQLRLDDLFHRPLAAGDLYLFDLVDKTEWENPVEADVLAMFAPGLALPRFRLEPRGDDAEGGRWRGRGRRVEGRAGARRAGDEEFDELTFNDTPAFDELFRVWAVDEQAARAFLTPARRQALAELKRPYRIAAAGQVYTLARPRSVKPLSSEDGATIDEATRLADAETLLEIFGDQGSGLEDW